MRRFVVVAVTLLAAMAGASAAVSAGVEADGNSVPRAVCGAGSRPETGLQGQVPRADRDSGRSQLGYSCNLELIGQYQGAGSTWISPSYRHCAYIGSFAPGNALSQPAGVRVVDVSDRAHPKLSTTLQSAAMLAGTWETLKVDPVHGRLVAMGVPIPPGVGGLALDVYDIATDCARPRLLNGLVGSLTMPVLAGAHEAAFSPDGDTYYVTSAGGTIAAFDLTNPRAPRMIFQGVTGVTNHGVSFSPDGRTMYGVTAVPAGVQIFDVSAIQDRAAVAGIRQIGALNWPDGLFSQMTIPFTSGGHRYLYAVDEADNGGVRLLDIQDPTKPRLVRKYALEIEQPGARAERTADTGDAGAFGYDAHYCTVDRRDDPTWLACGYFQSGVRLFDVTKPLKPRELAYLNPPAQVGRQAGTARALNNSAHAWTVYAPNVLDPNSFGLETLTRSLQPSMAADWCSSPPEFRPGGELWVTCQDNGFMVLRYTAPRQGSKVGDVKASAAAGGSSVHHHGMAGSAGGGTTAGSGATAGTASPMPGMTHEAVTADGLRSAMDAVAPASETTATTTPASSDRRGWVLPAGLLLLVIGLVAGILGVRRRANA